MNQQIMLDNYRTLIYNNRTINNTEVKTMSEREAVIAKQLSEYVNQMDEQQLFALTCRAGGMVDQKELDEKKKA